MSATSIASMCRTELCAIERRLLEVVDELDAPGLVKIARYAITSGGKRTRPLMLILTGELFGCEMERTLDAAVAVELMHTASLVHDDIVDEGVWRRGKHTTNHTFGTDAAMLCGDMMICASMELLSAYEPEVMHTFSRAGVSMAEGELLDVSGITSEEAYLECIQRKTASLFSAACTMGALIARASPRCVEACERMGWHVGMGYQMVDDLREHMGAHTDKLSLRQHPTPLGEGDNITPEVVRWHEQRALMLLDALECSNSDARSKLTHLIHGLTTEMIEKSQQ
ncbi:polyprenyl synthetase family protein [Methermicoccus shengliensis]|uniref:Polyprenyl synthetase family protein n=1 Tax=Methermicoccus shengliensis TaxID=660064 RepID=A0A832VZT6_9EURY|nr:polyprenyl synthetase family protein [Methermicoccus shengliensis]KUK04745.1 MAG: Geranylgeranyl pyrophosphate synthase [Euryarchaeota archaeon 55_53]KUK29827.1 MAG: Geranylgeranyl pyrophosphate synthase [Methanosarcinales archeaon 56_1174]MDI3487395.1 octaprenyl-diphosphate synthase [Methanosarcinales archaeon]MDN5295276.1 octaprenyl-diphosphate synthase [Methanosarcinales archaeon]HIH69635.1 polyprenyl synthetase family protein [Methermicoccus shengliensis]